MENMLDAPLKDVLGIIQQRIMTGTSWFGVKAFKNPLDFWVYQELIFERRPDVIVEIGNHTGGSALALAHLMDLLGQGRVICVDINHNRIHAAARAHPRIVWVEGAALDAFKQVRELIPERQRAFVIEDSSHEYENTLGILKSYSELVHQGDYFIVEDGICHHGLEVGPRPGPFEAVHEFLRFNSDFEIDSSKESFLVTWNPHGYLKRKSASGNAGI
jgi:cephalosporin hydroxylase